jgi:hypothetical protein
MTTATLHAHVQRTRFTQHTLAALAGLIPAAWRFAAPQRPTSTPTAAEAAAREAQRVRELASTYAKTDPGFASDLYAAAARHEGLHAD